MRHPAYHLRTNKAVDRLLFVAVLRKLDSDRQKSTYYSFGGPFLEDLRLMDHFFPEMKLVSLESSEQTFKRQQFNKFRSSIDLRNVTLADFLIHSYDPSPNDVFWLDYTDLAYERLQEFQVLLRKVLPNSVVRITLRAEPEIDLSRLEGKIGNEELERVRHSLREDFKKRFDVLLPHDLDENRITSLSKFPIIVQDMIRNAASYALDTTGSLVEYVPLQSVRYKDDTQMLSVTGIVCERGKSQSIKDNLRSVRFANVDWHDPDTINIPALSIKEILHLEPYLPVAVEEDAGEILFNALAYMIDRGTDKSKQQLSHYAECHRDYPTYVRVAH